MANIKTSYAAAAAITITLASLANNTGRESTVVDNSSNDYLDAELNLDIKMGAAAPIGEVYVLLSSTIDGTKFSAPATGADAALTPAMIAFLDQMMPGQKLPGTGLIFIGKMFCRGLAAAATVNDNFGGSIAAIYGGNLPVKWGIVVVNCTGQALDATEGNHTKQYVGVFNTSI
jgi:hypothetical protein